MFAVKRSIILRQESLNNTMSLYTKIGDKGRSSASGRMKIDKSSIIFEVLGEIDNLTCSLGFLQNSRISEIKNCTIQVQQDLLIIGSVVARASKGVLQKDYWNKRIAGFEKLIDSLNGVLPKLTNFIIPGGTLESSHLHMSRVECRKVERMVVRYWKSSGRKDLADIVKYLNRLSDLLFVLARYSNKRNKIRDLAWKGSK